MATLNLCQFIGNLGRDPETRYTADGKAVTNFSIAVSEKWKDKNGEQQEKTEWVRCTAFDRLAEVCGEFLKKGSAVYVSGSMQTRKWTDKDGVEKFTTEINVRSMQMLGGKRDDDDSGRAPAPAARSRNPIKGNPADAFDVDDDIPF